MPSMGGIGAPGSGGIPGKGGSAGGSAGGSGSGSFRVGYKFKDELISEMDDNQLANIRNEKIGFVFQTFNLLPKLNAMQNVEVPLIYSSLRRKERIERAEEALNIVGLQDRMTHKPNELSGRVWEG